MKRLKKLNGGFCVSLFGISVFIAFLWSPNSWAQSSLQTSIHHQYQSPRALGMGDAFVAVANDYSAVLYNPAGLARLEAGEVNMSIDMAFSSSFMSFYDDLQKTGSSASASTNKIGAYTTFLQNYYGRQFSVRTGLFEGSWVRPGWGISIIPADFTLDFQIHNLVGPALDLRSYLDTTVAYGYGRDFKGVDGRLSWGVTGKFVNRGFAGRQILPLDLAANSNVLDSKDLKEGYTVDADLGLLYSPFLANEGFFSVFRLAKPTFGLVLRNAGEIGFSRSLHLLNKDTTDAPEKLYRVLDVGAKFEYPNIWIFGGRGVVDIRDIGHPNFNWRKGSHIGFEFDWAMTSWWRGSYRVGLNQGYLTAGVSALFMLFNLDLVTYGEDVGSYSSSKENRIYMLKMNINL